MFSVSDNINSTVVADDCAYKTVTD